MGRFSELLITLNRGIKGAATQNENCSQKRETKELTDRDREERGRTDCIFEECSCQDLYLTGGIV